VGRLTPYAIGIGYGALAGLIGIAQWILTARDLDTRLAEFYAIQRQHPGFFDETNVDRGNFWFWFGTAIVAAAVMMAICTLAAYTASWVSLHRLDGILAGWVAGFVGGVMYRIATAVAVATSPVPQMTQEVVPCAPVFGTVFYCTVLVLVPLGAEIAVRIKATA
jgi:hypothetical protein